ncbi:hypothetical protein [Microbacterium ulmi]|uniref:Uncharacterized protein n=1 Tax=Microbacterium ulmi TaxID=179095 RepID=A0A7Y2M162_9MICO|nr:hypothetical protein [Microbacterium ulmi]NII68910.1 hypothetical protein [Microbacterium ulmi]NNH03894.1 hypothetical protein [Microbacterium ulmi]
MTTVLPEARIVERLQLIGLSQNSWRLCDRRAPHQDAASVLAYIERTADGYEVVWLQGGLGETRFSALADVLTEAAQRIAEVPREGPGRPVPIPHFPPPPV